MKQRQKGTCGIPFPGGSKEYKREYWRRYLAPAITRNSIRMEKKRLGRHITSRRAAIRRWQQRIDKATTEITNLWERIGQL